MTTFAELVELTTQITRRPELGPLTATAVRMATQRAHTSGFFARDSVSQILTCELTDRPWIDFQDPYTLIPNLRAIERVEMVDTTTLVPLESLTYEERTNMLDSSGALKSGRYVMEGALLRLYPRLFSERANVQFYRLPVLTQVGFQSWIADTYPEEVAHWAAAVVFARSGALEQAQAFQRVHVAPFKEMLLETYLIATVY